MHKTNRYNHEKNNFRKRPVNYKNNLNDYFVVFNCKKCNDITYFYKTMKSACFIHIINSSNNMVFRIERTHQIYFYSVQIAEDPIVNYYNINTIQDGFKLSKKILDNEMFM